MRQIYARGSGPRAVLFGVLLPTDYTARAGAKKKDAAYRTIFQLAVPFLASDIETAPEIDSACEIRLHAIRVLRDE